VRRFGPRAPPPWSGSGFYGIAGTALSICFYAFPDAEPLRTFAGNAPGQNTPSRLPHVFSTGMTGSGMNLFANLMSRRPVNALEVRLPARAPSFSRASQKRVSQSAG